MGQSIFRQRKRRSANKGVSKRDKKRKQTKKKHTTVGIRWWSPTQLLVYRSKAYVWQSGRDAQFSSVYGRMLRKAILF